MAPRSAPLAVILAACVAGAIAGAPREEWAERLRLLETRVEQSEQREAALHKRVAFLEGEVQRLRPSSEEADATAPKVRTSQAAVGSMGEPEAVGRRLSSAPTCCRWTPDDTCGAVPAERFEVCSHMHEYLESKTTTHEFADLDNCLGTDASKWSARFNGASSNVTLSSDAVVMATLKTPLKVTHAADCLTTQPTLTVQMDTTIGSLSVGALSATTASVGGVSLARASTGHYTFYQGCNSAAYDLEGADVSDYWCGAGRYCGCHDGGANAAITACNAKNLAPSYNNSVLRLCFEEAMAACDAKEHCLGFSLTPAGERCLCTMASNPSFYNPDACCDWGMYARASSAS